MIQYVKKGLFITYSGISITGGILYGIPYSKEQVKNVFFIKEDMTNKELAMEYIGSYLVYGSIFTLVTFGTIPYFLFSIIPDKKMNNE